jgi:hypothetical protein
MLRLLKLKILFTTGFSRNAVIHNGVLDQVVNFISKTFTVEQLAAKARAVLDDHEAVAPSGTIAVTESPRRSTPRWRR